MDATVLFFCISINIILIKSSPDMPQEIVFSPSELTKSNLNSSLRPALRYGFHRTDECQDFEKAYICVQKCVDLRYDLAYSDKHCFCTCYHKKEKAKYTPQSLLTGTKWKLGPPSTTKPAWAVKAQELKNKITDEPSDSEHEDDANNEEAIANTTGDIYDTNAFNESSTDSGDTNPTDEGNMTDGIDSTDSDVSNSTADPNSGGEGVTGATESNTDAGAAS